jgi:hypothetical protein
LGIRTHCHLPDLKFIKTRKRIKTAKIFSVASIPKKKGYGKLLIDKISKFVKKNCDCKFMTVDVVRPIISKKDWINILMSNPGEKKIWDLEKPTPHEIEEQDDTIRKLDDHTHLVCRKIQSSKRTERVQGLLDFYKRCNFTFQITPGDNPDTHSTLWGVIWPFYSYTLVVKLYKTYNASVTDNIERQLLNTHEPHGERSTHTPSGYSSHISRLN